MKRLVILFLCLAIASCLFGQKRALLIVDVQDFYFKGSSALVNPDSAAGKAAILLERFRAKGDLIVHVKHRAKSDAEIYYKVLPKSNEKIVEKDKISSFEGTDLQDFLKQNGVTELVICGMMTHMCVEAAFRAATDLGYKCTLIEDACATRNLTFNGKVTAAADVHNSTLATLTYYGQVLSLADFVRKEDALK